ncbi:hypothetical protein PA7_17440 [Pseudonocardia asaccharolytica DSM 44247 = NBRC 16224]|uniref:Uncharacterized protein n=1 Tax=Pseudonocardia asaccharolytica DSM 44247 = NBRC 16224 TaxID=1123024 RepID=A0A511CZL5_9PSEU|nr:hypothetical protein PA7_17440 [Pseudonocardia asaccharolytica DSM 44247 = NBRC 16224]
MSAPGPRGALEQPALSAAVPVSTSTGSAACTTKAFIPITPVFGTGQCVGMTWVSGLAANGSPRAGSIGLLLHAGDWSACREPTCAAATARHSAAQRCAVPG